MKTIRKLSSYMVVLLTIISAISCQRKGCTDELALNYNSKSKKDDGSCFYDRTNVVVNFNHTVGTEDLEFNVQKYISAVGHKYDVEKLRYIISNFVVKSSTLGDVQLFDKLYIDAQDATTLSHLSKVSIPAGDYTGISFTFGLSDEDNTNDAFTTSPEINMVWPDAMGGGFHFMQLEGYYDSLGLGTTNHAYNTHIGSIDGMGMKQDNSWSVSFDESFSVAGQSEIGIHLAMDIQEWYQTPNTYDFTLWNDGIMMNMTAQTQLKENGQAGVFSLEEIHIHAE